MTEEPANLIECWLSLETTIPGRTQAQALRDMARATGGAVVTHSRLGQWRRGERTPSPAQCRYMTRVCLVLVALRWLPADAVATLGDLDAVARMLTPPDRRPTNGRSFP